MAKYSTASPTHATGATTATAVSGTLLPHLASHEAVEQGLQGRQLVQEVNGVQVSGGARALGNNTVATALSKPTCKMSHHRHLWDESQTEKAPPLVRSQNSEDASLASTSSKRTSKRLTHRGLL